MKRYEKPMLTVEAFASKEQFSDLWNNIFGTGNDIPVTFATWGDTVS